MTHHTHPGRTFNYRRVKPSRRLRRLCRRLIGPLALLCLAVALSTNGYVRLAGSPADKSDPFAWSQESIFIAASSTGEATDTICTVAPEDGAIRRVTIPHNENGIAITPWFSDRAEIICDHRVSITVGWHTGVAGYCLSPIVILALAGSSLGAWWIGRYRP